ncbi:hypothetical protein ACFFX1_34580 [Dactylosporangium sucinum]|uniref:Uncharacterized protein n=1 Tax=Dactylosporangium sucinum TaxID=1424081 RepID=A0A917X189_9ACTN|nr:hypothetical protein [Dactylosporangium sucinum]GGM50991.1 hypothetical protein GCM10007977_060980 [Dactylosporangium sucinum]
MKTKRATVATLAGPAIRTARDIYTTVPSDAVRVAALVDIAGAAAALARTVVKLRRLDPDLIAPHVADRTDLRAVLGRGQWLPTMLRHIGPPPATAAAAAPAVPMARSVRRRVSRRRPAPAGQGALFTTVDGRG